MIKKYYNNIDIEREIAEQKLIIRNAEERLQQLYKKLDKSLSYVDAKDERFYNATFRKYIEAYVNTEALAEALEDEEFENAVKISNERKCC